jgi:hypothetical protein
VSNAAFVYAKAEPLNKNRKVSKNVSWVFIW